MSRKLREIMAALVMATLVSTGAVFAQGKGRGQDKKPEKKAAKIIDAKGGSKPNNPPPQKPPKEDRGKKRP